MGYTNERRTAIFIKTDGNCHICHGRLSFAAYGDKGHRGGWEVEHSVPKAKGGTGHLNNLFPAHINCNRRKRTDTTSSARAQHGHTRAPYSRAKKEQIHDDNTAKGVLAGATAGAVVGGPVGAAIGALLGGLAGNSVKVPK